MLFGAGRARAEEARKARLEYVVDAGVQDCFDAAELEDAVAARLGYVPFSDEAPLSLKARVRRNANGLAAELKVKDESGERNRSLGSATRDCQELSRSLALAISVAIDPLSLMRAPAPPPSEMPPAQPEPAPPSPVAPPANQPPPPPPPATPPAPRARSQEPAPSTVDDSRWRLRWLATGHAALFTLPSSSGGASVGLGLRRRALWADLELRYDLPASKAADAGGSVQASLLAGALAACHGSRSFGICALGLVGRLAGEGQDVDVPKRASSVLAGGGLRATLELPLSTAISLRAHVDGLYVATSTRLELRGHSVWETGPVALAPGIGLAGEL
ncbi:MAG TPA: hypothetical protein VHP33_16540 [Polyangiaceae bacterium]|nr:hypothetical protein [Polyangiaceae bacterium]